MTAETCISYFKHIWDSYRDEGLYDIEICNLLNIAQSKYIRGVLNNDLTEFGLESTQWSSDDIAPLISNHEVYTSNEGVLFDNQIAEDFPSTDSYDVQGLISTKQTEIIHISSMRRYHEGSYRYVRWERHNDYGKSLRNPFKQASDAYPTYRRYQGYFQLNPESRRLLQLTVIRSAKNIWFSHDGNVRVSDPEMSDHVMIKILEHALLKAGINMREGQFYQMINNETR